MSDAEQDAKPDAATSNLRANLASAFGIPEHLKQAFQAWIASIEERLGGHHAAPAAVDAPDLDAKVKAAVEQHMAENADKYKGPPGEPGAAASITVDPAKTE